MLLNRARKLVGVGRRTCTSSRADVDFAIEDTAAYLLRNILRGEAWIYVAAQYCAHDIRRRHREVEPPSSTMLVFGWHEHGFGTSAKMTVALHGRSDAKAAGWRADVVAGVLESNESVARWPDARSRVQVAMASIRGDRVISVGVYSGLL